MAFTAHCESVGWLIAICASPTTAVLPLRNVSSFHRYSRQALSIKARGMKGLRRVIIDMAAAQNHARDRGRLLPICSQRSAAFIHATANGAPSSRRRQRANNDRDGDHDHPEHEAQATFSLPCTK